MTTDFNLETTSVISIFALAWFIAGILVGRIAAPADKGRSRRSKKRKERKRPPSEGDGTELYVGNLSYDVSSDNLEELFSQFGKVVSTRIIENRFNGKSKGFGFVELGDRASVMDAIKQMNGQEFMGRKLVINEAKTEAR